MIGYRLEDDLLKNIRPDSRMEKFCTRLLRASCSDHVGPVDLSLGYIYPWAPGVSGTLSWSQVFLFCHLGYIFSKSGDCGNILLRSGGSGIYPPETWRFVGLVTRNPDFVELILLEPEGFGVDPSETWRFPDAGELLCLPSQ
ncbi:hypothetical protein F2Q69_00059715 [Brassica cretica]|uniref:Uncharacterized protein n=1 Tax=Brassica cretica TaxID=69181 RepID=A0A8S9RMT1_BRACR|nr:hypothetical protein F2Q69_00059715 [Brassica cretica]